MYSEGLQHPRENKMYTTQYHTKMSAVIKVQRKWRGTSERKESLFLKNKFIYYLFIYLFLAVLDLRCWAWAFSSCGERGLLFIVVHGVLIAVASLVAEHRL